MKFSQAEHLARYSVSTRRATLDPRPTWRWLRSSRESASFIQSVYDLLRQFTDRQRQGFHGAPAAGTVAVTRIFSPASPLPFPVQVYHAHQLVSVVPFFAISELNGGELAKRAKKIGSE